LKIAYLMKQEVDPATITPPGVETLRISAGVDGNWDPDDLARLHDVDALMVWSEPVTPEVIAAAPLCKIVQRVGVGYDVLLGCFDAARERGIPCCNLAGANKEAVAEHGMLLILAAARGLPVMHEHARHARWPRQLTVDNRAFELVGKTLGIVGLGNTGSELAKRARAFGMWIVYNDVREIDPALVESLEATFAEKDDLWRDSDVISINTDLNPTSRGMVDGRAISLMKPSAILVCCARGGIIDELALRDALNGGRLAAAGIDVFSPEPLRPDNPLLSARNVVLSPHIAGVTRETMRRQYTWAHDNVRRVVEEDRQPQWVVNGL